MGFERSGMVVVVGSVNVDFVVVAPRLPAPGETVVGAGMQTYGGGKGANAAVAAARAGAEVHLIAAVGADAIGAEALAELQHDGVQLQSVAVLEDQPTGVALIVVDQAGENQIAVGGGANAALSVDHVRAQLQPLLKRAGVVLISSEIPPLAVATAIAEATRAGVRCVLNPAPVHPSMRDLIGLGVLLTPNETELQGLLELVSGAPHATANETESVEAGAGQLARLSGQPVIVTQGAQGVLIVDPDGTALQVPAVVTVAVDTTGAGDTFNGILAARLAAGDTLAEAVRIGVIGASLSVAVVGARGGMPTAAEIDAALPDAAVPDAAVPDAARPPAR
jgi:ribokinase